MSFQRRLLLVVDGVAALFTFGRAAKSARRAAAPGRCRSSPTAPAARPPAPPRAQQLAAAQVQRLGGDLARRQIVAAQLACVFMRFSDATGSTCAGYVHSITAPCRDDVNAPPDGFLAGLPEIRRSRRPSPGIAQGVSLPGAGPHRGLGGRRGDRALRLRPALPGADLALPAGTVTFGHFWGSRPYNVYHWLTPAAHAGPLLQPGRRDPIIAEDSLPLARSGGRRPAAPGSAAEVLDEDELPADLGSRDVARHRRGHARRCCRRPAAIAAELENRADRLWQRVWSARPRTMITRGPAGAAGPRSGWAASWSAASTPGLLLLVGVERGDGEADADATARKVAALRIFPGRTRWTSR